MTKLVIAEYDAAENTLRLRSMEDRHSCLSLGGGGGGEKTKYHSRFTCSRERAVCSGFISRSR